MLATQQHLNLHIGKAEYKAIADGGLVDPDREMQVLLDLSGSNCIKERLFELLVPLTIEYRALL
jgi:chorismate mutase